MNKDLLDKLVTERDRLQDRLDEIDSEIFQESDQCSWCRNYHYPHCNDHLTTNPKEV